LEQSVGSTFGIEPTNGDDEPKEHLVTKIDATGVCYRGFITKTVSICLQKYFFLDLLQIFAKIRRMNPALKRLS